MILYGNEVAKAIDEKSMALAKRNKPVLAIVRVGNKPSDLSYERGLMKRCEKIGVEVKNIIMDEKVSKEQFYSVFFRSA